MAIPPIQEPGMVCSLFQRRDTMKESRENRSLWYLLRLQSLADGRIGNDSQCDEKEWGFLTPGPEKKLTALRERWKIEVEGDNLGISQFLYPAPLAEPGKEGKKLEKEVYSIQFIAMLERAQEGQEPG